MLNNVAQLTQGKITVLPFELMPAVGDRQLPVDGAEITCWTLDLTVGVAATASTAGATLTTIVATPSAAARRLNPTRA
jgi:hypothetical protein